MYASMLACSIVGAFACVVVSFFMQADLSVFLSGRPSLSVSVSFCRRLCLSVCMPDMFCVSITRIVCEYIHLQHLHTHIQEKIVLLRRLCRPGFARDWEQEPATSCGELGL